MTKGVLHSDKQEEIVKKLSFFNLPPIINLCYDLGQIK